MNTSIHSYPMHTANAQTNCEMQGNGISRLLLLLLILNP